MERTGLRIDNKRRAVSSWFQAVRNTRRTFNIGRRHLQNRSSSFGKLVHRRLNIPHDRDALNCSALPVAKSAFSLIPRLHDEASSTSWLVELASSCKRGINGKKQHRCRQQTNRCRTSLTCYKCGKHTRRKYPS